MERLTTLRNRSDHALQSMRDLYLSRENSDVTLVCDDQATVMAHKFVLGFHSSVFKSVLQNVNESPAYISIPETKSEDLDVLLNLIYFRTIPGHEENNQYLLELMKRFNIEIPDIENIKQESDMTEETEEAYDYMENIEELVINEMSATDEAHDFAIQEDEIDQSFSEKLEKEEFQDFTMVIEESNSEKENSLEQIKVLGELEHSTEDNHLALERELEVKKYKHEKTYFCNKCQMTFLSDSALTEHYETKKHKEIKNKCTVCKKKFRNEMMLKIHMEEHQEELVVDKNGRFCCNKCDKTFKDIYKLRSHKVIHVQGLFSCDYCPSKFVNYHGLKYHLEHPDEVVECDQCGKKIRGKFSLKEHKLSFHQGLRLKCNFCDRGFKDSSNLAKHVQADHLGRRFNCDQCGYSAKKRSFVRIHIDAEHPTETSVLYKCQDCQYKSFSIDKYKHHRLACRRKNRKIGKIVKDS